jgi:hypothetical protein
MWFTTKFPSLEKPMKNKSWYQTILALLAALPVWTCPAWSGDAGISIRLRLEGSDPYYHRGDRLPVTVEVKNGTEKALQVSQGFKARKLYYDLRIIDPAGRLVQPKRPVSYGKGLHAPPLAFVRYQNKAMRVAPCETFPQRETVKSRFDDLNQIFDFQLPGIYSAQVQASVMVFKEQICTVDSPRWAGVLSSKTVYFYHEGKTNITVKPSRWRLAWKDGAHREPVRIRIIYPAGKVWEDYDVKRIRLENRRFEAYVRHPDGITFEFKPSECIGMLGQPQAGRSYPVRLTGWYKNGQPFGGARKIIVTP